MSYYIKVGTYERTEAFGRLGRHIAHDSRARLYAYTADPSIPLLAPAVRHHSNIAVLDQGDIGACTGFAGAGLMGYDQYWTALPYSLQQSLANNGNDVGKAFYSLATQLDAIPGTFPPDDTGSDGPSSAKAMTKLGYANGFKHSFSYASFATALQLGPVMVGTDWYNSMFDPDATGKVRVDTTSGLAGGHEYVADEYNPTTDRIGFLNSWGDSFGVQGRFYMTRTQFTSLLAKDGDATIPAPVTAPAPTPSPAPVPPAGPDADALAAYLSLQRWAVRNGVH